MSSLDTSGLNPWDELPEELIMTKYDDDNGFINQLPPNEVQHRVSEVHTSFANQILAPSDVASVLAIDALAEDNFAEDALSEVAEQALGPIVVGASVISANLAPLAALVQPGLQFQNQDLEPGRINKFKAGFKKDYNLTKDAPKTAILVNTSFVLGGSLISIAKFLSKRLFGEQRVNNYLKKLLTPENLKDFDKLESDQEFTNLDYDQKIQAVYAAFPSIQEIEANFNAFGKFLTTESCTQNPPFATYITIARLIELSKNQNYYSYLYDGYFDKTLSNLFALLQSAKNITNYKLGALLLERLEVINQELEEIATFNPFHLHPQRVAQLISSLKKQGQNDTDISNILKDLSTRFFEKYKLFNSYLLDKYVTVPQAEEVIDDIEWMCDEWDLTQIKENIFYSIYNQILLQEKSSIIAQFMNLAFRVLNAKTKEDLKVIVNKSYANFMKKYER